MNLVFTISGTDVAILILCGYIVVSLGGTGLQKAEFLLYFLERLTNHVPSIGHIERPNAGIGLQ